MKCYRHGRLRATGQLDLDYRTCEGLYLRKITLSYVQYIERINHLALKIRALKQKHVKVRQI
jgi:hypothetical protein